MSANDSRYSGYTIARNNDGTFRELEIGLIFLERAYNLVKDGGRIGIVLPETYFFSTNYQFVLDWIKSRLKLEVVANVPMEAFQGFCRAKTNFYVFRKYPQVNTGKFKVEFTYPVTFLNPKTCGIYKNGETRFKLDPATGMRTDRVDNELLESVESFLGKRKCDCRFDVPAERVFNSKVIFRVLDDRIWDPFYLFWALCIQPVREQWRRIVLMQTNREDCGDRYREIVIPRPHDKKWAMKVSENFREYFQSLAEARAKFVATVKRGDIPMIASASGAIMPDASCEDET